MTKLNEAEVGYLIAQAVASAEKSMLEYPQPNYVAAKLAEELGEFVRAYIHRAEGRATTEELRGEAVQLIGLVLRLFFEGDLTILAVAPDLSKQERRDAEPKQPCRK